jgi:hypothetical protein
MAKNPAAGTQDTKGTKAPSAESIGQKVTRRLKDQTNRLMDRLGKSDDVSYGLIHEALLHAWTDGHDDASTAAVRMVDEAFEVATPATARAKAKSKS